MLFTIHTDCDIYNPLFPIFLGFVLFKFENIMSKKLY